jgi:hypothetical protein
LSRYNNDGSLDNAFGFGGKVITGFGSFTDHGFSVAIQGNAKIIVGGVTGLLPYDFALVRYNNDGTLDNTFGSAGAGESVIKKIVLQ